MSASSFSFLHVSCVRLCWWRKIVNDGVDMISAVSLSHEIMTRWLSARISPAPHHCTTHTTDHMINWKFSAARKNVKQYVCHLFFKQSAFWKSKVHCHNKYSFTLPADVQQKMIIYFMVCMILRISWENYWKNDCQVFSTWSHSPGGAELLICWQESQFKCRGCRWCCHELGLTWIMCLVHQSKAFSSASTILIS